MSVEATSTFMFNAFYAIFALGFLLQFKEFYSFGLSPENLLSSWIQCSEDTQMVEFQLRRSCAALMTHSSLPLGTSYCSIHLITSSLVYLVGRFYFSIVVDGQYDGLFALWKENSWMLQAFSLSITLLVSSLVVVYYWSLDNWSGHPYVKALSLYGEWRRVASSLNVEFRAVDKFVVQTNPFTKVIVTENWLALVGQWPWQFRLAHQSDVGEEGLSIDGQDQHVISTEGHLGGAQYLSISVSNRRPGGEGFSFRLNSLEYQNLQDRLRGPIRNAANVQIYKTVSERFVEIFREEVARNPSSSVADGEELDSCIGCMQSEANVRLIRRCLQQGEVPQQQEPCVDCFCRPMWCIDCMAKW